MTTAQDGARRLHATALALAQRGQLAQAVPLWGEALRLDADNVDVLVHLGHALAAAGDHARATELATRAARLAPQAAAPWLLLGLLGVERGELETALQSYALAERHARPDEVAAVAVAHAKALLLAGQREAARQRAARAGDGVEALLVRARLAVEDGDVDGARALLVQAGERDPEHPEPYKALAVLLAASDPGLARELVQHALTLAPDDAEAQALRQTLDVAANGHPA